MQNPLTLSLRSLPVLLCLCILWTLSIHSLAFGAEAGDLVTLWMFRPDGARFAFAEEKASPLIRGFIPPSASVLSLKLINPEGKVRNLTDIMHLTSLGYIYGNVPVEAFDEQGRYTLRLRVEIGDELVERSADFFILDGELPEAKVIQVQYLWPYLYRVRNGDTVYKIATMFVTDERSIEVINHIDRDVIEVGQVLQLGRLIYDPQGYRIVIDKQGKQLHIYLDGVRLKSYPVTIGATGYNSPTVTFWIVQKQENPTLYWEGSVIPSPNALGPRWLQFFNHQYGTQFDLHGTNKPWSIGRQFSHGSIRMFNDDVVELYRIVPIGTIVEIANDLF
ncbi:MAG: L,D-transpeptidase family protein [Candidatus Bipolaricaulia bacterium]